MAPEVYKDEIFDRSVDAYSFGLILYEVRCDMACCLLILRHFMLFLCLYTSVFIGRNLKF